MLAWNAELVAHWPLDCCFKALLPQVTWDTSIRDDNRSVCTPQAWRPGGKLLASSLDL